MNFFAPRVALGLLLTLAAAAPGRAQDSKPVLLSRTGGGSWSNVKELKASADRGNPKACAQLGEMLLRGAPEVPQDVPRAKNFNYKLNNFQRFTGGQIYGRMFSKSPSAAEDAKPGAFMHALAEKLGVAQRGAVADRPQLDHAAAAALQAASKSARRSSGGSVHTGGTVPDEAVPPPAAASQNRNSGAFSSGPAM